MARYLEVANRISAEVRSRQAWISILGRAKQGADVTEFLYEVLEHPNRARPGNKAALVIPENTVYTNPLSVAEQNARRLESEMITDGWIARDMEL